VLTRSQQHDAEDILQEAYLRALTFIGGYQEGDARARMLKSGAAPAVPF
jgi:DNA-directed RNA polymerase specialized sigma24 family protein